MSQQLTQIKHVFLGGTNNGKPEPPPSGGSNWSVNTALVSRDSEHTVFERQRRVCIRLKLSDDGDIVGSPESLPHYGRVSPRTLPIQTTANDSSSTLISAEKDSVGRRMASGRVISTDRGASMPN